MFGIEEEIGLIDESIRELHQQACSLECYSGEDPLTLPEHVRRRLKLILERLLRIGHHEQSKVVLAVTVSVEKFSVRKPEEMARYMQEHGMVRDMRIEEYFYQEGFKKIHIRLLNRETKKFIFSTDIFTDLVPFFKNCGNGDYIATMGSYDIIELTVFLN